MRINILTVFLLSILFSGCALFKNGKPQTLGEKYSSYGYIPVDPLPVFTGRGASCKSKKCETNCDRKFKKLLDALPDQTVRLAIKEIEANGSVSFTPVSVGVKNKSYQVTLDYINVDVTQLPVYIEKSDGKVKRPDGSVRKFTVTAAPRFNPNDPATIKSYEDAARDSVIDSSVPYVIPVYIGIGLRLTANLTVLSRKADLSSLGAIAAEAKAGKVIGTLTVQTLGITGKSVAISLPLPNEINTTTIQNAIVSIGSIKATLFDTSTVVTPRVVGFYDPIGGGQDLINGVISALAKKPIIWYRPCVSKKDD